MKGFYFLILFGFVLVLLGFQFSVGQIIEDDVKEKTNMVFRSQGVIEVIDYFRRQYTSGKNNQCF